MLYKQNIDWQEMCFDKYFAFNLCSRVSRNLSNQFENSASLFISCGTMFGAIHSVLSHDLLINSNHLTNFTLSSLHRILASVDVNKRKPSISIY